MTIAAGIDQLIDDLADAYDALEAAGASIPADKNTHNLANTIFSLLPATDYGTVLYYSQWEDSWISDFFENATFNGVNETTFESFCTTNNIQTYGGQQCQLEYDESTGWVFYDESWEQVIVPDADLLTTTGLNITLDSGAEYAYGYLVKQLVIDTSSPLAATALLSATEYSNLTDQGMTDYQYTIGGNQVPRDAVYGFIWGTETYTDSQTTNNTPNRMFWEAQNFQYIAPFPSWLTKLGEYFLANCTSFNYPIDLSGLSSVGGYLLYYCINFDQPIDFSAPTTIGEGCLWGCSNFNSPVVLPYPTIPNSFLYYCNNFNQPITIESGTTSIGTTFLCQAQSFNQNVSLPNSIASIGQGFLASGRQMTGTIYTNDLPATVVTPTDTLTSSDASSPSFTTGITISGTYASDWREALPNSFDYPYRNIVGNPWRHYVIDTNNVKYYSTDASSLFYDSTGDVRDIDFGGNTLTVRYIKEVHIAPTMTTIGDYFCNGFTNLTGVYFGNSSAITAIGNGFLRKCTKLSSWTTPPNVVSIGDEYLRNCTNLSYFYLNSNTLETIGNYFLAGCTKYNRDIYIRDATKTIGTYFLYGCTSFNATITFGSGLESIGNYFMNSCSAFNKPLDFSKGLTTIGEFFLQSASSFNSAITLPDSLTTIGNDFLYNCNAFNQAITIPSGVRTIGGYFIYNCGAFNQNITIPANITGIGGPMFGGCKEMVGTITFNVAPTVITDQTYKERYFATGTSTAPCYVTGMTLAGPYAADWHAAFPDRTVSPYRKTIVSS